MASTKGTVPARNDGNAKSQTVRVQIDTRKGGGTSRGSETPIKFSTKK